jgi:hypothetical protein
MEVHESHPKLFPRFLLIKENRSLPMMPLPYLEVRARYIRIVDNYMNHHQSRR